MNESGKSARRWETWTSPRWKPPRAAPAAGAVSSRGIITAIQAAIAGTLGVVLGGAVLSPGLARREERGCRPAGSTISRSNQPTPVMLRLARQDGYSGGGAAHGLPGADRGSRGQGARFHLHAPGLPRQLGRGVAGAALPVSRRRATTAPAPSQPGPPPAPLATLATRVDRWPRPGAAVNQRLAQLASTGSTPVPAIRARAPASARRADAGRDRLVVHHRQRGAVPARRATGHRRRADDVLRAVARTRATTACGTSWTSCRSAACCAACTSSAPASS